MLKVPCPNCNRTLNLPDHFAGKQAKCPACMQGFAVPGGADTGVGGLMAQAQAVPQPSAPAAVAPSEEMAWRALAGNKEEDQAPATARAIDVCPGCGAKWKKGAVTCGKCYYNIYAAKRIRPAARGRLLPQFDVHKLFLWGLAIAAAYGAYWLYTHYTDIKHKGDKAFDDASRGNITTEDDTVMIRKETRKADDEAKK